MTSHPSSPNMHSSSPEVGPLHVHDYQSKQSCLRKRSGRVVAAACGLFLGCSVHSFWIVLDRVGFASFLCCLLSCLGFCACTKTCPEPQQLDCKNESAQALLLPDGNKNSAEAYQQAAHKHTVCQQPHSIPYRVPAAALLP